MVLGVNLYHIGQGREGVSRPGHSSSHGQDRKLSCVPKHTQVPVDWVRPCIGLVEKGSTGSLGVTHRGHGDCKCS